MTAIMTCLEHDLLPIFKNLLAKKSIVYAQRLFTSIILYTVSHRRYVRCSSVLRNSIWIHFNENSQVSNVFGVTLFSLLAITEMVQRAENSQ